MDGQGPRLRPRRRALPVRRLRLRQARPQLPADPRPLLPHTKLGRAGGEPVRVLLGSGAGHGRVQRRGKRLRQELKAERSDYSSRLEAAASSCARRRRRPDGAAAATRARPRAGSRIAGFGRYRGSLVARATGGSCWSSTSSASRPTSRAWSPNEVPSSWPADGASRAGGGRALLRARDRARRPASTTTPTPAARSTAAGPRRPGDQPGGRRRPRARSSSTAARSRSPTTSRPPAGRPRTRSSASRAASRFPI